ncbi:hypothetical protein HMPREF0645_2539 [Hallella bergensis DSM 17361]|uniref:Uncharacterized protein n=1 Tax=Hallella bergensis DSM 17361 TaxID=585502 RepID=D1Q004_9BACT|nr:hypothetical protein HMPREF0645_2539 [Hallella bergensis DSM 17361]
MNNIVIKAFIIIVLAPKCQLYQVLLKVAILGELTKPYTT